jgi:hypothetical protein
LSPIWPELSRRASSAPPSSSAAGSTPSPVPIRIQGRRWWFCEKPPEELHNPWI